ncbi:hypothetical protein QQF64_024124 [Cirrhinus molitorella]|uniref:Uncharacterized protein n=1 Tax=Cirrhinus molitorella TaxID=172907 RepID=A0ABR3NKB9_9TELE
MRLIKDQLQSLCSEERLSDLLLIDIKRDISVDHSEVINIFKHMAHRRCFKEALKPSDNGSKDFIPIPNGSQGAIVLNYLSRHGILNYLPLMASSTTCPAMASSTTCPGMASSTTCPAMAS